MVFRIFVWVACALSPVAAAILQVPADYPTINSAMNATNDGDTVVVDTGVYRERIVFPAGTRTLASRYLLDPDSIWISSTILEPDSQGSLDSLCMVDIHVAAAIARICGFTLQNGRGVLADPYNFTNGGAVFLRSGNLCIDHCVFQNNIVPGYGAAICADSQATLTVRRCDFHHDSASAGGIAADLSTLTVVGTRFHHSIARWAAAIYTTECTIQMDSCLVDSNDSPRNRLAAVYLGRTPGIVSNSDFVANATDTTYFPTAALSFTAYNFYYADTCEVRHCRFTDNVAQGMPALAMGALYGVVEDCIFDGNRATWSEGSMHCGQRTTCIFNCVFRESTSPQWSVMAAEPDGQVDLINCQFVSNTSLTPDSGAVIFGATNLWTATNCIFERNAPAAVNNSHWPFGQMHMENCWWGDASGPYHATLNPDGQGETILGESVCFVPWLTEPPQAAPPRPSPNPLALSLSSYPNPFNPVCTISYSLPRAGVVTLTVFDVTGRQVQTLVAARQDAGDHTAQFNGNALPSGIYFARVQAADQTQTRKMVLLR